MIDCVQKSICNLTLREIRCLTPIFNVVVCIETCKRVLKTPLEIFCEIVQKTDLLSLSLLSQQQQRL